MGYIETILNGKEAISQFKKDCPGKTTVPQIIIDGVLVEGGYEGLVKLFLSSR